MTSPSHLNRWLAGAVVLLLIVTIMQAVAIVALRAPYPANEGSGLAGLVMHRIQNWVAPPASTAGGADAVRWESAEDIRRLLQPDWDTKKRPIRLELLADSPFSL